MTKKSQKETENSELGKRMADAFERQYKNAKKQHEKKQAESAENWIAFSYTDGKPTAWAGWMGGMPFIRQIKGLGKGKIQTNNKKITLKEYDGKPIQEKIERAKSEDGTDLIIFGGETYTKPDFVKKMVYPINTDNFTECLNAIPVSNDVYMEPKFYLQNAHIKFPDMFYAKRGDSYRHCQDLVDFSLIHTAEPKS